jgi:hypothetical protein
MAVLRGCYDQIFRPRFQFPKISNGLHRHTGVWPHLDLHLIRQTTKCYVEGGNVFWFVAHTDLSL